MTTRDAAIVAVGIVLVGVGGYLVYAKIKGKWPFKPEVAQPPGAGGPGTPPSPTSPPTVGQITYDSSGKAKVPVDWQPVQGATYYQVIVNGNVAASNVQGTHYELILDPGQTYHVAIAACA